MRAAPHYDARRGRGAVRWAPTARVEEIVVVLPETMRREAGEVAERLRVAIA